MKTQQNHVLTNAWYCANREQKATFLSAKGASGEKLVLSRKFASSIWQKLQQFLVKVHKAGRFEMRRNHVPTNASLYVNLSEPPSTTWKEMFASAESARCRKFACFMQTVRKKLSLYRSSVFSKSGKKQKALKTCKITCSWMLGFA